MLELNDPVVFAGGRMTAFGRAVCQHLSEKAGKKIELGDSTIIEFDDDEPKINLREQLRDRRVYLLQTTYSARATVRVLTMTDAVRRASGIPTVVIPYFGYGRQDRKDEPHAPITAKVIANCITVSGATRVVTMDLHASQIQGFFDIPVDHLYASGVMCDAIAQVDIPDLTVVAPDVGAVKIARAYARILSRLLGRDVPIALINKRRGPDGKPEVMAVIGDVQGRNCLIPDDIISTGGTQKIAADALRERGAKDIYVAASHLVFCGPEHRNPEGALENLRLAGIKQLWYTDSIPVDPRRLPEHFALVSVAPLFAETIWRIHTSGSVSELFRESIPR